MANTPNWALERIQQARDQRHKTINLSGYGMGRSTLRHIPPEVFELDQLEALNLSQNLLSKLPPEIGRLADLEVLTLYGNQFSELPLAVLQLTNLRVLDMGVNRLTALPSEIARLSNLTELHLYNNRLTTLPSGIGRLTNLRALDLTRNSLTKLPSEIAMLENLVVLNLEDNPLVTPPPEIVNGGIGVIRRFFQQTMVGVERVYEAKLLIVGEPGAGKTTLAKKLQNPSYELQDEVSTAGIDVVQWGFPFNGDQKFRVNIWDFGGQEIYHATHQFFLTKRSLYVLVADTRKEDTDFFYWLNAVELLSHNSPVLIVKNEKQDWHREINERQLRGQFTNLKETLVTNLATNRGLGDVLEEVKHHIQQLPHIGSEWPKTWVRVREVLEDDSRNYITFKEYQEICEENGFAEREQQLQLSGYLHDLGVCLHFQDDSLLKRTVILKPEWGTGAVYRVVDNKRVIRNLGQFTCTDLEEIWHEEKYAGMQDELLQLMRMFQLCYEIPNSDGHYIAPQLLTDNQPEYDWDERDNLLLRYSYEFMPKGILTRFIVAMHQFIADQACVWKSGVVLEKNETKAEVVEHYDKREVRIRVAGKGRRDLLTILVYELDRIHNAYHRLKFDKLIPCDCRTCRNNQAPHFFRMDDLIRFRDDQRPEIQCLKSGQMVKVQLLIDDAIPQPVNAEDASEMDRILREGKYRDLYFKPTFHGGEGMPEKKKEVRSAWANGLFYLFVFVVVIAGLAVLANTVPWYWFPIAIVAGAIFVPLIGALQLVQDKSVTQPRFMELMAMVLGQLPLIGKIAGRDRTKE